MINRVLLVEDEPNLKEAIKLNLEMEGMEVVTAETGTRGLTKFREQRFNLVILDIMLPEMDGYSICEQIRLENSSVPILFLTAKDSSKDKIHGFKSGADDYITKPFNLEELLLRVKVLVRHSLRSMSGEKDIHEYQFGPNTINFATYEANGVSGNLILTKKEAKLLKLLVEKNHEVVSRQQILQYVWGYDVFPSTRTIDNFILSFRKYFEEDPRNPRYFHSVRGVGYKFTA